MKSRYQYRIYPTDQQCRALAQLFGCVRVVWNDALALWRISETKPSNGDLQKICITQAKKTESRAWLSDVSNIPLQQSINDLGVAFKNYFDYKKGKRKGRQIGFPAFKKKTSAQSARFSQNGFSIKAAKVYLAKIGEIKTKWSRPLPSQPSSVTVIRDCAGRYFLSFVVEIEPINPTSKNQAVGIDLGIKTFAVCSTGESFNSPNYKKLERKLKRLQCKMSRCVKGSNRRNKVRLAVAKVHAKIADKRKDFLHKLSTKLVVENQVIILEDLNTSGMLKNRKLAKAIAFQGWRVFRDFCSAKADKFTREFRTISRWEPTSQICSDCGYRWGKLDLSVRTVKCCNCGKVHDRDENASKNIEKVGLGRSHDSKRAVRKGKTTPLVALSDDLSTCLASNG